MTRAARIIFILAAAQIVATVWLSASALGYGDFPQLLDSARAVLRGEDLYFSGSKTIQDTRNLNPPHLALLMAPLAVLPLASAAIAMWAVIVAAVVLFARAVRRSAAPPRSWTVLAVLLASSPANVAISLINVGWPLAAATAWSWNWLRIGRTRRAVVALGCLASLKLFYLLFVPYWIWRRQWRSLAWFSVAFAGIFGVGVLAMGTEPYAAWLTALGTGSPLSSERPLDASWHSVVTRSGATGRWATGLWLGGAAVILVASWWRLRQSRSETSDWALILTAMLMLSPLGWIYYGLIPALPVAILLLERHQVTAAKVIAIGLLIPAAVVVLAADRMPGTVIPAVVNSFYAITLAGVWLVQCYHPERLVLRHNPVEHHRSRAGS